MFRPNCACTDGTSRGEGKLCSCASGSGCVLSPRVMPYTPAPWNGCDELQFAGVQLLTQPRQIVPTANSLGSSSPATGAGVGAAALNGGRRLVVYGLCAIASAWCWAIRASGSAESNRANLVFECLKNSLDYCHLDTIVWTTVICTTVF